jgi:hypothetical protein
MSNIRNVDPNLLAYIRDLNSRIERLEKGDKAVRVNDTRLGNAVLSPNTYTNQIEMKNLKSGEMVPLTSVREVVWSWSGTLQTGDGLGDVSPTEVVPDTMVANEIVISRPIPAESAGGANIRVIFPGFSIYTGIAANTYVHSRPIHIQVNRNDVIYLRLDCAETSVSNVSVAIRFGEPTDLADNNTREDFCTA